MTYQLGKNPPVVDDRTLRLDAYVKPELPSPPAAVSYGARVSNWPMYYNNQYLDCTCAAVGHMIQNWTANASAEVTVEPPALLAFYERIAGTSTPPGKNLDLLAVLKYWRRAGLEGHKVLGFASVALRDRVQAQTACWLFGSVYIGVALPDFAAQGDVYTVPWVVPLGGPVGSAAPNPDNGHCIVAVSYDADNLYVVTWGEIKSMSWEFYDAYAEEAFAVISKDFIEANGLDPAGFDLAAIEKDVKQLAAAG
jgi:hypothetical protein